LASEQFKQKQKKTLLLNPRKIIGIFTQTTDTCPIFSPIRNKKKRGKKSSGVLLISGESKLKGKVK